MSGWENNVETESCGDCSVEAFLSQNLFIIPPAALAYIKCCSSLHHFVIQRFDCSKDYRVRYTLLNDSVLKKYASCLATILGYFHKTSENCSQSSPKWARFHLSRGWKFLCSSQIPPYVSKVKSGMNTETANACCSSSNIDRVRIFGCCTFTRCSLPAVGIRCRLNNIAG